jgi:hypothetical protein
LQLAFEQRLEQYLAELDADGLSNRTDCDLALWAGISAYAGAPVDLSVFEYAPGVIHRRPEQACWTKEEGDVGAKSTVSNDMLTGYILGAFAQHDLEALIRLADYGEAHSATLPIPGWIMGEPYPERADRVVLRPNGAGAVSRGIYALSAGAVERDYRITPPLFGFPSKDFEYHIQTLGILTEALIAEFNGAALLEVTELQYRVLQSFAKDQPSDALIQAAFGRYTGDMQKAAVLLLDPNYQSPSYVRGHESYHAIHWLSAAKTALSTVR